MQASRTPIYRAPCFTGHPDLPGETLSPEHPGKTGLFNCRRKMLKYVVILLLGLSSCAAAMTKTPAICKEAPPCQTGGCYATCHNQCGCEGDEEGRLVNPVYGGVCRQTGEVYPPGKSGPGKSGSDCIKLNPTDQFPIIASPYNETYTTYRTYSEVSHVLILKSLFPLHSDPDLPVTPIYRAPRFTGLNSFPHEHPGKTGCDCITINCRRKMLKYVVILLLGLSSCAAMTNTPAICKEAPPCQTGGCYATCHNQCGCEGDEEGRLVNPVYGGLCRETGFCEEAFAGKEECIAEGGESCPEMISMERVLEEFTKYDFRIDVRSDREWEEGHANMSIHVPGLATMDQTYTRSVNSFYEGGLPSLSVAIRQQSYQSPLGHPTKNFCYLTGASDICPQPLPLSHIQSSDDIMGLGNKVILVDARPVARYPEALPGAVQMFTDKMRPDDVIANLSGDETLVTYCMKGILSFRGAKALRDAGWTGQLYFIDNELPNWCLHSDLIMGKEKFNVLVYCRSGTRAFHASVGLLKCGFESVNSFYEGGLPSLSVAIRQQSYQSPLGHPTKNFCYLTGASDICPQPLPLSHIQSSDDIMGLGNKVILVDARPVARYPEALPGAVRMFTDFYSKHLIVNCTVLPDDVIANLSGDETLVTYCMKGILSFRGAKALRDAGWTGQLYFIDNGGFTELKELF
eukprot:sb/3462667/